MDNIAAEGDVDLGPIFKAILLLSAQVNGRQNHDCILTGNVNMHMDGGAHEFSKKYHLVQTLKMTNVMFR